MKNVETFTMHLNQYYLKGLVVYKNFFCLSVRCATSAVICYWDDYLDVVGPTQDTIRYPLNFVT